MSEWLTFKSILQEKFKEMNRTKHRASGKLSFNLSRRRTKLVNKRAIDEPDFELEERISAIEVQQQCLAEWQQRAYTYNAYAKNMLHNEKPTKWFYSRAKAFKAELIEGLRDVEGEVQTDPDQMVKIAADFYSHLYETKDSLPEARKGLIDSFDRVIPDEYTTSLVRKITPTKVQASISRTAIGKSPGIDGLPCKIYKSMVRKIKEERDPVMGKKKRGDEAEYIRYDQDQNPKYVPEVCTKLAEAFNQIHNVGAAPECWTEGVLTILFKNKGDKADLKMYRPLCLMNVDYKIYTEVLM